MKRLLSVTLFLLFIIPVQSFAQRPSLPTALYNTTIENQFNFLNTLSRSQQDFKLIRRTNLDIVKKSVLDTVNNLQKQIIELKESSVNHNATVQTLQDSVSSLTQQLDTERSRVDSISFLGMSFSKSGYHSFVWTIILVLAVLFLITFASFRKAKIVSVEEKKNAEELQEEIQAQRKKALEKEQKLKRQLLDEQMKRNS